MWVKLFKAWLGQKDGSTAIEFSMLAIPYVMLTVAIIELSISFASATLLEAATNSAARMIRTGELQQSSEDPETMFRDQICDYATVLINCNDVIIEVQTMASFSDFGSLAPQFDENGSMVSRGFSAGGSSDRVLIRVSYTYNMMTPFIGQLLAGQDGSLLFMSTIVLQTEPYDFAESV